MLCQAELHPLATIARRLVVDSVTTEASPKKPSGELIGPDLSAPTLPDLFDETFLDHGGGQVGPTPLDEGASDIGCSA